MNGQEYLINYFDRVEANSQYCTFMVDYNITDRVDLDFIYNIFGEALRCAGIIQSLNGVNAVRIIRLKRKLRILDRELRRRISIFH